MKHDPIKANVLSTKLISKCDPTILKNLGAPDGYTSIGIITSDCDDVSYVALDEATKTARVQVIYAKSMYAGAANASTKLVGEFIGIIAGLTPADVQSGLQAATHFIENEANFVSADDNDEIAYFAHCISRTGSYLSQMAGIKEGDPLAYLIAPPMEAIYALDGAMKSADVEMKLFYGPPTETNFGGGLLTGDQAACRAACRAFAEKVCYVADNPLEY